MTGEDDIARFNSQRYSYYTDRYAVRKPEHANKDDMHDQLTSNNKKLKKYAVIYIISAMKSLENS